MSSSIKFLKNGEVVKLREFSRSYGGQETIKVSFIVENENSIDVYGETGFWRTFKKGTKLLVDFNGKEVKESTFKKWLNQNTKDLEKARLERISNFEAEKQERLKNEEFAKQEVAKNVIENKLVFVEMLEKLKGLKEENKKDEWHIEANKMVQFALVESVEKNLISFKDALNIIKENV
jgi:hypothetical protein